MCPSTVNYTPPAVNPGDRVYCLNRKRPLLVCGFVSPYYVVEPNPPASCST
jgi:hypothetical protein